MMVTGKNFYNRMVKHCAPQTHCMFSVLFPHHHNYKKSLKHLEEMRRSAGDVGAELGTVD
jgi:hypothetical protein